MPKRLKTTDTAMTHIPTRDSHNRSIFRGGTPPSICAKKARPKGFIAVRRSISPGSRPVLVYQVLKPQDDRRIILDEIGGDDQPAAGFGGPAAERGRAFV